MSGQGGESDAGVAMSLSKGHSVESDARREVEDLWWLHDSLASLLGERPDGDTIRVGALRGLLKTTAPETTTTHPRNLPPAESPTATTEAER